jgi:hypothetical protein
VRCITIALIVLASAAPAAAQEMVEERQMTLPAGRAFIQVFAEINLSEEAVAKPLSIAPDLWYGVSNELSVGLVHSGRAATGFYGGVGNGLCLSGEDGGCAKVYDNVGLDVRYHFYREGDLTLSADGGLFVGSFDPFVASLKVGAIGRYQAGALALEAAPALFAGLTQREPEGGGVVISTGNKEIFFLPVSVMYALSPSFGLAAQVGATVPFENAGDLFTIGASLGVQYLLSSQLFLDAAFSLPLLAGGSFYSDLELTGTKARSFTLGVGYAL